MFAPCCLCLIDDVLVVYLYLVIVGLGLFVVDLVWLGAVVLVLGVCCAVVCLSMVDCLICCCVTACVYLIAC